MIPIAVRTTEEFLRAVPNSLREGAMALGATKAKAVFTVVVPAAIAGLTSGMMLNLARVAGETAPLIFTALGNQFWSKGWLAPTATLPVMIYNYAIASSRRPSSTSLGRGLCPIESGSYHQRDGAPYHRARTSGAKEIIMASPQQQQQQSLKDPVTDTNDLPTRRNLTAR